MPKTRSIIAAVERSALASIVVLAACTSLKAAEPAPGAAPQAPAVQAAPELAPGIAPGVVPGARPGPAPMPLPSTGPAPAPTPGGEEAAPPVSPKEVLGSPDWPCIQRKVPELTPAQLWDGPSIDDLKGWENDEKVAELTTFLESRRVPIEQAEKAIKEFAKAQPEAERDQRLSQLFASVLAKVNTDRKFVMGRIEEFQRRQKARAQELEREGQQLSEKNQAIPAAEQLGPRDAKLTPEQEQYNWNARIFQERQQNLSVACEIPTLIEQRAYDIARLIRAEMKS
jgi:hypothetical protein